MLLRHDTHVQTAFGSEPSWRAVLQLEHSDFEGDEPDKICLPLCNVALQPKLGAAAATRVAERLAKLLRLAWPDAVVFGPAKRRQFGPPFDDPALPDYQLFRWLASKNLNPVSEGVSLNHLSKSGDLLYQPLRQKPRGLVVKPCSEAERTQISVGSLPRAESLGETGAQIWSFTGPDQWVISLPVLATILLLATHPTKEASPLDDNPDRDLSWTLDSLHGFCREESLEEGNRHLSWSFGTYPDQWMYLNFIFHYFTPHDDDNDQWAGSGIRCDRRTVTVQLGGHGGQETFKEQRVWFSMRTATAYKDPNHPRTLGLRAPLTLEYVRNYPDPVALKGPSTVGFVLADIGHFPVTMTNKEWKLRELAVVQGASGITAFQMLLWAGVDEWSRGWNACLEYLDKIHKLQVDDITGSGSSRLRTYMLDGNNELAQEYFVTASLLNIFRLEIDVLPRSFQQMRSKWDSTYPGVEADLTQRFDASAQLALLENWSRLIDHAGELHGKLAQRIEKRAAELLKLRDSLMLAKLAYLN